MIARMNIGGPALHVSLLSGRLDPARFETLLVSGRTGRGEGSFDDMAEHFGAIRVHVPSLSPALDPIADLRALGQLSRLVRRFRPDIVHTHTAKAGFLGRTAAIVAGAPRPIVVHTFHGHVLEGYFGTIRSQAYRRVERALARSSDALIGVSGATVDDLVRLGIAPREKFRVMALGLELDRFLSLGPAAAGPVRAELGLGPDAVLATFVGRLVPIKRVDRLIRAIAAAHARDPRLRLAIVGDGDRRGELEALAASLGAGPIVHFLGYRRDLESVIAGTDVAVLSSDNEGTPVALIEAAAAGRPLVATDVGGVSEVVVPGTGLLFGRNDVEGIAGALVDLAGAPDLRRTMGEAGRRHVAERYATEALLRRVASLYEELAGRRAAAGSAP